MLVRSTSLFMTFFFETLISSSLAEKVALGWHASRARSGFTSAALTLWDYEINKQDCTVCLHRIRANMTSSIFECLHVLHLVLASAWLRWKVWRGLVDVMWCHDRYTITYVYQLLIRQSGSLITPSIRSTLSRTTPYRLHYIVSSDRIFCHGDDINSSL